MGKTTKTKTGASGRRSSEEPKTNRSRTGTQAKAGSHQTLQQSTKPGIVEINGFEGDFYGPYKHAKGLLGEINAAHALARKYGIENVIIAPKEWVNQGGVDLIVYDSANDTLLLIDNKATKATHIHDATALTKNLDMDKVRLQIDLLPYIDPALKEKVLSAIDSNRTALRVTTELGNGVTLGSALIDKGATIENLKPDALKNVPATKVPYAHVQPEAVHSGTITADRTEKITVTRPEPESLTKRPMSRTPYSTSDLYDGDFGNAGTAVKGAVLDTVLGGAQNLFNDKFKDYMRNELNNMPMPKVDRRLASRYFIDPNTSKAFNVLDVFNKNLPGFGRILVEQHIAIVSDANKDTVSVLANEKNDENRLFDLETIRERLYSHEARLRTVLSNLDAALEMETQALEAAEASEELERYIHVTQGQIANYYEYKPNDITQMQSNLRLYARLLREGYQNVRALKTVVEPLLEEAILAGGVVNRVYWGEAFGQANKKMKRSEPLE
ncbi:MAG: hypothetical protein ACQEXQ_01615 [Bacillota bacterium]